jgi:hypothetical protein
METSRPRAIPVSQALVLCNQEQMGMAFQSYEADVSQSLRQGAPDGIQISSGEVAEDYRVREELLLLFPAAPINGLEGYFVLTLSVNPGGSARPCTLTARQAQMVQEGDRFAAQVELKADGQIDPGWAYTRRPGLRQVNVAMFDNPDMTVEGQVFHQVSFPVQQASLPAGTASGWTRATFPLDPYFIQQSRQIDHAERLLEAMDRAFTAQTNEYLQWSAPLVTASRIDAIAVDMEERLRQAGEAITFDVTVAMDGGEITRGKRLRPLVRHTLTLIGEDGTALSATISISASAQ